jgi:phosphohistidine phosphatase SixA
MIGTVPSITKFAAVSMIFAIIGCASQGSRQPLPITTSGRPTVVVLVRHAEKSAPSGDVALSAAGEARAQSLAAALANARIDAVITTTLQRTRQTAEPIVHALGLTPVEVAPSGDVAAHAQEVASIIRARFGGRTVLVVGHSNTIPAIVRALGGPAMPDLCDSEYATLFVVVLMPADSARVIRSSYGAPDASTAAGCPAMR